MDEDKLSYYYMDGFFYILYTQLGDEIYKIVVVLLFH